MQPSFNSKPYFNVQAFTYAKLPRKMMNLPRLHQQSKLPSKLMCEQLSHANVKAMSHTLKNFVMRRVEANEAKQHTLDGDWLELSAHPVLTPPAPISVLVNLWP